MAKLRILVFGILLLAIVSCTSDSSHTVQFYASATISLSMIGYFTGSDTDFEYNILVDPVSPWSIEVEARKDDYVAFSISGDGDLIARIYIDGILWKEKTGTSIPIFGGYLE